MKSINLSLSDFPSKSLVNEAISFLKNYQFPHFNDGMSIDSFVESISTILTRKFNILFRVPQIDTVDKLAFKLFRARELTGVMNRNSISEYTYAPPRLTKSINRCNFPHFPVFYCSTQPLIALSEVVKNENFINRRYIISKWEVKLSSDRMLYESYIHHDLPKESSLNILRENALDRIPKLFQDKLTRDQLDGLMTYLKFLSESFMSDPPYSVSTVLSHRALYASGAEKNPRTDLILYPSIQAKSLGINLAIHPAFVDSYLSAKRFYEIQIEEINKDLGMIKISFVQYGYEENGKVSWYPINPNDSLYRSFLKDDFGFDGEFLFTEVS